MTAYRQELKLIFIKSKLYYIRTDEIHNEYADDQLELEESAERSSHRVIGYFVDVKRHRDGDYAHYQAADESTQVKAVNADGPDKYRPRYVKRYRHVELKINKIIRYKF